MPTIIPAILASVVPEDVPREVAASHLVDELARRLLVTSRTFAETTASLLASLALPDDERTVAALVADVEGVLAADASGEDEPAVMRRAVEAAVSARLAGGSPVVQITGWLRGETVVVDGHPMVLTGSRCLECQSSPEALGDSGGLQCADRAACGWWHCA